jgi:hypothetical protein
MQGGSLMTERERRAGFLVCLAGYCDVSIELDGDGLVVMIPPKLAELSVDWWEHNLAEFADEIHNILKAERAGDAAPTRH